LKSRWTDKSFFLELILKALMVFIPFSFWVAAAFLMSSKKGQQSNAPFGAGLPFWLAHNKTNQLGNQDATGLRWVGVEIYLMAVIASG